MPRVVPHLLFLLFSFFNVVYGIGVEMLVAISNVLTLDHLCCVARLPVFSFPYRPPRAC